MSDPQDTQSEYTPAFEEQAGHCFGCGRLNPAGLKLEFVIDQAALTATAPVNLSRAYEGGPGYVHGGILATLLDEAMAKLNRSFDVLAVTRNLQVEYLLPVPIEFDLVLVGSHVRREGRKLFHRAELKLPSGTVVTRGEGLFIALEPEILAAKHRA